MSLEHFLLSVYNEAMFSLGNLHLSMPFILAPISGVSDLPFRLMARDFGCPLAFAEMVSARALTEGNRKTIKLLQSSPLDKPLGIQFLASEPNVLARAVELSSEFPHQVLDLNAACPVGKVTRKGEGAALMREPVRLSVLVRTLVAHAKVPVTVKIRSGWDDSSINACEIAKRIEDAGATAVCVHGRTKEQAYGGKADFGVIRDVKAAVTIPVIASGDIFSDEAAMRMMRETGCDAVTVARGAFGSPWIFREIAATYHHTSRVSSPNLDELKAVMKKHLLLSVECHGPIMGVVNFRKFFCWYIKGLRRARLLRPIAVKSTRVDEMMVLIDELHEATSRSLTPHASPDASYPDQHRLFPLAAEEGQATI